MAHPNHNHEAHKRWNDVRGDDTHRLNYPDLNENSLVWDLGAYHGDWAAKISDKYNCKIMCFEPVPAYAKMCEERFKYNPKVVVLPFGLGAINETVLMDADGDGSTYKETGTPVEIKSITEIIERGKNNIDLIKINIESAEFDLMDSLIEKDMLGVVNHYQIQFHPFIDDYKERHDVIVKALKETHNVSYSYPFIWEGWKRK